MTKEVFPGQSNATRFPDMTCFDLLTKLTHLDLLLNPLGSLIFVICMLCAIFILFYDDINSNRT